ncbi:hypothetical protein [Hoeflea sp.]|uniref:hypothetical protein n=1 Tax=Hoeflea sp. TaxID=1940281 RepID=UPI003B51EEAC
MSRAKKALTIWVGNTNEFRFRLKQNAETPLDLTGSTIVMTIVHGGDQIVLSSAAEEISIDDPTSGEFVVPISVEQSRSVQPSPGAGIQYEIERRIDGKQTTIIYGSISLAGGNNAD